MIRYIPEPGSPLAKLWPDGVIGELAGEWGQSDQLHRTQLPFILL